MSVEQKLVAAACFGAAVSGGGFGFFASVNDPVGVVLALLPAGMSWLAATTASALWAHAERTGQR